MSTSSHPNEHSLAEPSTLREPQQELQAQRSSQLLWFARSGFCFAVEAVVEQGVWMLKIHYDNCCQNRATAAILLHVVGTPLIRTIAVEAEGGETGCLSVPWAVPERFQGRLETCQVCADVHYPDETGALLRNKQATLVNAPPGVWLEIFRNVLGALVGSYTFRREATLDLQIPSGVASELPEQANQTDQLAPPAVQYTLLVVLVGIMLAGCVLMLFPGLLGG